MSCLRPDASTIHRHRSFLSPPTFDDVFGVVDRVWLVAFADLQPADQISLQQHRAVAPRHDTHVVLQDAPVQLMGEDRSNFGQTSFRTVGKRPVRRKKVPQADLHQLGLFQIGAELQVFRQVVRSELDGRFPDLPGGLGQRGRIRIEYDDGKVRLLQPQLSSKAQAGQAGAADCDVEIRRFVVGYLHGEYAASLRALPGEIIDWLGHRQFGRWPIAPSAGWRPWAASRGSGRKRYRSSRR